MCATWGFGLRMRWISHLTEWRLQLYLTESLRMSSVYYPFLFKGPSPYMEGALLILGFWPYQAASQGATCCCWSGSSQHQKVLPYLAAWYGRFHADGHWVYSIWALWSFLLKTFLNKLLNISSSAYLRPVVVRCTLLENHLIFLARSLSILIWIT